MKILPQKYSYHGTFIISFLLLSVLSTSCSHKNNEIIYDRSLPSITPDYINIVIPPNIAPLNFQINETGIAYKVKLSSYNGTSVEQISRRNIILFPSKKWHSFIEKCKGNFYTIQISVKQTKNTWRTFAIATNYVSSDQIDSHLVYRFIPIIHRFWALIEIHDRDLTSFEDKCVVDNENFGRDGCINCHSFVKNSPRIMSLQVRSKSFGPPMLIARDNKIEAFDLRTSSAPSPAAYHSWHPSGQFVAFSRNKLSPFEHSAGIDTADVWDEDSNLFIYDIKNNSFLSVPHIARHDRRETWPAWSSDGNRLYFCSAPQIPFGQLKNVRYDLMRIEFDPEQNKWGEPETLVSSETTGLSAAHPRESPDGQWLLFTMSSYGNFPIYKSDADIYLLDLKTMELKKPAINSEFADSWCSWSSNGKWIAFASKRGNGLFTRIYFSSFDGKGNFSKPFILPQKHPDFYDSCAMIYNIPELITDPIPYSALSFQKAICSRIRQRPAGSQSEKSSYNEPVQWQPIPAHQH